MKLRILGIAILSSLMASTQIVAIARYHAMPLSKLKGCPSVDDTPCISFAFKKFDKNDCKKYLGRDQIIARGYQPIQIHIRNNTDRTLEFSLNDISLPCFTYQEVAKRVHFNTGLRLFGWGVATLFVPLFVIPFVMEAVESPKANNALEEDYVCKSLNHQLLEPHNTINGVIFTSTTDYNPNFSFVLTDQMSNESFTLSTANPRLCLDSKK